jgi:hypothetical protein
MTRTVTFPARHRWAASCEGNGGASIGEPLPQVYEGDGDLVLLVTCVPAYSVEEVVFTE